MGLESLFAPTGRPQFSSNPGGFGIGGAGYTPTAFAMNAQGAGLAGAGGAGMSAYNPSLGPVAGAPPPTFQQPTFTNTMGGGPGWGTASSPNANPNFTNSMSPESWNLIAAGIRANQSPDLFAGGPQSQFAKYGSYNPTNALTNPGQFNQNASNMGYPALGVGGGWPTSGGNTIDALTNAVFGRESNYGQHPGTMTMDKWHNVGPMRMSQANMNEFAPGQSVYNPAANMAGGQAMLGSLLNRFGDPGKAAMAYNVGPTFMAKGLTPPPLTKDYEQDVLGRMVTYGQQVGYGKQADQALQDAGASPGVPGFLASPSNDSVLQQYLRNRSLQFAGLQ